MLVTSSIEKKKVSKAKQNILCLLCILLSAFLFYVVGMAYKKPTGQLIDLSISPCILLLLHG
jgi:hypothetical protein